ncbi:MAG: hypothetical protein PHR77_03210 [Kiritimatiellae bacterium]|nr:hypothetical protein [Kiritimatiellia bacterium]MDD5519566.1 hypothetical protein [Kiritimatiellia bacterium]
MVNYYWTTSDGHRVTEYRPMNIGVAVLYSPCMPGRNYRNERSYSQPETEKAMGDSPGTGNMLTALTNQQLKFNYLSKDVLRQLLEERVTIRNRNRSSILGRLTDISGEIYGASVLRTPEAEKQKQSLEKTRMDLERQLGEEDVTLWRDSLELRRELILADKTYTGTQFRQGLMRSMPSSDDNKGQEKPTFSG